jgi:hypothetical protein
VVQRADAATLHSLRDDPEADIRELVNERLEQLAPTTGGAGVLHG